MSAKPKRKTALVLYDDTPLSANRLRAMILALASDNEIDASMRAEILSAVKSVEAKRANEEHRRVGTPVALHTFRAAALARELISKHSVKPAKCAITVAVETVRTRFNENEITYGAVARRYREIKDSPDCSMKTPKGDKIVLVLVTAGLIDDALARLPVSAKGIRTNRIPKPPFGIVVAHLFKPTKNGNK